MEALIIQLLGSYVEITRIIFNVYSKKEVYDTAESGVDSCHEKQERFRDFIESLMLENVKRLFSWTDFEVAWASTCSIQFHEMKYIEWLVKTGIVNVVEGFSITPAIIPTDACPHVFF